MQKQLKKSDWYSHIRSQRESGLSRKAYCRQHKLVYHQFQYYERRYQDMTSNDWSAVKVEKVTAQAKCSLQLPSGAQVHIHDVTILPELLKIVG